MERTIRKLKSHEIARAIAKTIQERKLSPGTPILSTSQLAERFHVSMSTANRVLDTLEAQRKIVREKGRGNFVLGQTGLARKFVFGLADDLEAHPTDWRNALVQIFPHTVREWFNRNNCEYRLVPYIELMKHNIEFFSGLDGLLVSSSYCDDLTKPFIRSLKLPVVIYKGEFEIQDLPCPQVVPDLHSAINQIPERINLRRYHEIVIFRHTHENARARSMAFQHCFRQFGFETEAIREIVVTEQMTDSNCLPPPRELRGRLLLTCSDLLNPPIISRMAEANFSKGNDYGLIGIDNLEAKITLPKFFQGITSIEYDRAKAARAAAMQLAGIASKSQMPAYNIIKFPATLTVRESTG